MESIKATGPQSSAEKIDMTTTIKISAALAKALGGVQL